MSRVTKEWVSGRLRVIEDLCHDPELAHQLEKELWAAVLIAIANDEAEDAKIVAAMALKSESIPFVRWFA